MNQGQTYERSFDRPYNGKVCVFAEVVMAYVKTDKKGAPRWREKACGSPKHEQLVEALSAQGLFDGLQLSGI